MHLPYADSARLIVGAWWLVVLVVATTYCGNLVAFLTFPKIDIPITTIDELLAHKDTVTWSLVREVIWTNNYRSIKVSFATIGPFLNVAMFRSVVSQNTWLFTRAW